MTSNADQLIIRAGVRFCFQRMDQLTTLANRRSELFIFTFGAAVELIFSREGKTGFIDDCWIAAFRDD